MDFEGILGPKRQHWLIPQKLKVKHLFFLVKCHFSSEEKGFLCFLLVIPRVRHVQGQGVDLAKSIHYSLNTSLEKKTGPPFLRVDFPPK